MTPYKLNKSISGHTDALTDDQAFSAEEIDTILNANNFTILVAGEEEIIDKDNLKTEIDFSDDTTVEANSSFTASATFTPGSARSFSTNAMTSPSANTSSFTLNASSHSLTNKAVTTPMIAQGFSLQWDTADKPATTSKHYVPSAYESDSESDSEESDSDNTSPIKTNGLTTSLQKENKSESWTISKSKFFARSDSDSESSSDNTAPKTRSETSAKAPAVDFDEGNEDSDPMTAMYYAQQQNDDSLFKEHILDSLSQSFATKLDTPLSKNSLKEMFAIRYVMNIYQNENKAQIAFPDSIYHGPNKPRDVSGFHAEQLLAFYLIYVKKINLHATDEPPIPLGISKLCCVACSVLYHYERLSIRGTSFNNILGVPCIVPPIEETDFLISSAKLVAGTSFFDSPFKKESSSSAAYQSMSSVTDSSMFGSPKQAGIPLTEDSFLSPGVNATIKRCAKDSPWS